MARPLNRTTKIFFRLSKPLPTWNTFLRIGSTLPVLQRRMLQRKKLRALAKEVWEAMLVQPGQRLGGQPPFIHAKVLIVRCSVGEPDPDGVSYKHLLDVLQPFSQRHPYGLGVITNDNAECLFGGAVIKNVRVAHRIEQCTMVTIEGDWDL